MARKRTKPEVWNAFEERISEKRMNGSAKKIAQCTNRYHGAANVGNSFWQAKKSSSHWTHAPMSHFQNIQSYP